MFHGDSRISALPPYLTVQMMRFFYKADVQQKAKILRRVTFPLVLDTLEFCTPELAAQLKGPRLAGGWVGGHGRGAGGWVQGEGGGGWVESRRGVRRRCIQDRRVLARVAAVAAAAHRPSAPAARRCL